MIGGGPAGYAAALRGAHRGLDVVLVEADQVGGVCLNRGCIPTKAMLHAAELAQAMRQAADLGIVTADARLNYSALIKHRTGVVDQLRAGVTALLRSARVDVRHGVATVGEHEVRITGADGTAEQVPARNVLIATGSRAAVLPVPGHDLPGVLDSDAALELDDVPARILIAGGGAIGCEWAAIFAALGSRVVLVEIDGRLLPDEDAELGTTLARSLADQGVDVRVGTALTALRSTGPGLVCELSDGTVDVDRALLAPGRVPRSDGLGLAALGVEMDTDGGVRVDDRLRTSVPWLSAAGDVTGTRMLAHVATYQAEVAVDVIAGLAERASYHAIPSVTYTFPEVVSVGQTEAEARATLPDVIVGRFPLAASGRAVAVGAPSGFVKIVAEAELRRVVGVQLIGPHAGELAAAAALAVEMEVTLDDLAATVHAHPTISESFREAALVGLGLPLHVPAPRARPEPRAAAVGGPR